MRFGSSALQHIHRDLMLRTTEPSTSFPTDRPKPLEFRRTISLHTVSFAYPGQTQAPALKDLTLDIAANTSVGIVGATGSGKSTLVDLILGLITPQQGTVTVDDTVLTPENIPGWQRSIGYVPQQIYIADSSVAENIAFGVNADAIDHGAVERAARAAQIHDFVSTGLPQGYRTQVGERGVRLSGGQRQRIGIARALYRDPAVLILDEATSALDNLTEQAVMAAIRAMGGRKTIILIAHRLTTVQSCNKILLLRAGTLESEGTFAELNQSNASFRSMASAIHPK
jgi:ATP-binding cassette, subfamily B, bacterial PglK